MELLGKTEKEVQLLGSVATPTVNSCCGDSVSKKKEQQKKTDPTDLPP